MPQRFDKALLVVRRHVARHGDESERASYNAVAGLRDTFTAWCEHLAVSPVAPSLDHSDLHPRNILMDGAESRGQVRFFDWGTSVIAHPFTSMLIPLRFVQRKLRASSDDPAVQRARDAYLDSFRDLAPHAELVITLEAACQVAKVIRSLVWISLARDAGAQGRGKRQTALQWLTFLLDDSYLGRVDRPSRARPLTVR
jgi:aminoglycoside phosphotransferase (APT) family kinase protein